MERCYINIYNFRSGTREVHNKLEKNRRAHLKECFELLKKQVPASQDEKKTSNLSILRSAIRYIQVCFHALYNIYFICKLLLFTKRVSWCKMHAKTFVLYWRLLIKIHSSITEYFNNRNHIIYRMRFI